MSASRLVLLFVVASFITGCLRYGDAPVYGAYRTVSQRDLQDAVAAAFTGKPLPHKVYEIHIANKDEVWIYYSPPDSMTARSYYIAKRINGRWRCDEMMHDWRIEHHV